MSKNILVAGSTRGFLSGNLIKRLIEKGYNVVSSSKKLHNLEVLEDANRFVLSALCDDFIDDFRIDAVINCAARVGGILANLASPATFFDANVRIGINLIEAVEKQRSNSNNPIFINIGTTCSYPANTPVPFKEEFLWQGLPEISNRPYALAKLAVIEAGRAHKLQYGLDFRTLMLANLYGENDSFDDSKSHVIPAIIKKVVGAKATKADSINLFGDGTPSRDFLYVGDACDAIIAAIERSEEFETINVGSGQEYSIVKTAETICDILGYTGTILFDPTKPNGQNRRCLDISKAKTLLNWTPKTSLEDGLRATVKWYEQNLSATA